MLKQSGHLIVLSCSRSNVTKIISIELASFQMFSQHVDLIRQRMTKCELYGIVA